MAPTLAPNPTGMVPSAGSEGPWHVSMNLTPSVGASDEGHRASLTGGRGSISLQLFDPVSRLHVRYTLKHTARLSTKSLTFG